MGEYALANGVWVPRGRGRRPAQPVAPRRWASGKTNRLTAAHWAEAQGQTLNQDLMRYLPTVRARCEFEASRNPLVQGVINTYVEDLIGADYPTLQVQSSSKRWNQKLEEAWADWWEAPEITGRLSGADLLKQWGSLLWTNGECLAVIVNDTRVRDGIQMRLMSVAPRRLDSTTAGGFGRKVAMGIEIDDWGRPIRYFIVDETLPGEFSGRLTPVEYAADWVIHEFAQMEPGQLRGVPWLAACLQSIADLGDFDDQVLDAARAAAQNAQFAFTRHPDATYIEVDDTVEIHRNSLTHLPPGWELAQMAPAHPSNNYVEFRAEREREIGRPVGMPLMMIRLDSSQHNYSSARFDAQVYQRCMRGVQGWLGRRVMTRLVRLVAREMSLLSGLKEPERWKPIWTWPVPPHVDPTKEADAEAKRFENGTLTVTDALASQGKSLEEHLEAIAKEKALFEAAGLDYPVGAKKPAPTPPGAEEKAPMKDADGAEDEQTDAEPKEGTEDDA